MVVVVVDVNIALERTLKVQFKTTDSSSPSILTKNSFLPGNWGGGLGPLGPPCLRQWRCLIWLASKVSRYLSILCLWA